MVNCSLDSSLNVSFYCFTDSSELWRTCMFKAVNPKVDIQKLEQEQLDFWRMNRIFQRSMTEREGSPRYVTFEGPPTVNGTPGVHHVLARAFKDIFPRYKTMQGFYALRKGGWDTHGL